MVAGALTSLESNQHRTVAAQTRWPRLQHVLINRIKPLQGPCARTRDQERTSQPISSQQTKLQSQQPWWEEENFLLSRVFSSSQVTNQAAKAKCVKMQTSEWRREISQNDGHKETLHDVQTPEPSIQRKRM